jgi:DNA-binding SARP family transcriptional activator
MSGWRRMAGYLQLCLRCVGLSGYQGGQSLSVELLGAVRAWCGDRELDVGAPLQRGVLGVLATRAHRVVSRSELIDALWGADVPSAAAAALYGYVARLRRVIEPERAQGTRGGVLASTGGGYVLRLRPDQLDAEVFAQHLGLARRHRQAGGLAEAVACFDAALALWHGTPWAQIPGPFADVERARLVEARLTAIEDRAEALLGMGGSADLAGHLSVLVAEHPFRERLCGLLMTALYRRGRPAEALRVYADARRVLLDELGVEPGPELQRLQDDILNSREIEIGSPSGATPDRCHAAPAIPRQLPPPIRGFAGRISELRTLNSLADQVTRQGRGVVISAIDGTAGVGKTSLAVSWAHQVAGQFSDGQLYVDLRGFDPREPPVAPSAALAQLLAGLGVDPRHMPGRVEEQVAQYRTMMADRRALVVLDNAASAEQVRPLLPAGRYCLALITSRNVLDGLIARDGADRIALDVLTAEESHAVLAAAVGADRVGAEPDAAAELAELCGRLPLALRIAAARLVTSPHSTLTDLVGDLTMEHQRLDLLTADETTSVRAVLSLSYQGLPADAAHTFRCLGLYPGTEISSAAIAALTARPHIRPVLEVLARIHMIQVVSPARYRMHDLLRLFAAERAMAEESEPDRAAAVERLLTWYLHAADAADRILIPNRRRVPLPEAPAAALPALPSHRVALEWCEAERANLVAFTRLAAESGHHPMAWQLPVALWGYFMLRKPWPEWEATHQIGLASARHIADRSGEAHILGSVAFAHLDQGRYAEATMCMRTALDHCLASGDEWGCGVAYIGLSMAHRQLGDHTAALDACRKGLAVWRRIGDEWGMAHTLNDLGVIRRDLRQPGHSIGFLQQAADIFSHTGDQWALARALTNLGASLGDQRRYEEAMDCLTRAMHIRREIADLRGQAETLDQIATIHDHNGLTDAAHAAWQTALDLFETIGDPQADRIRTELDTAIGMNTLGSTPYGDLQEIADLPRYGGAETSAVSIHGLA